MFLQHGVQRRMEGASELGRSEIGRNLSVAASGGYIMKWKEEVLVLATCTLTHLT